jgi:hypothetical protein
MKYRIKKIVDFDGIYIYRPQFRNIFIYWDFWELSFPPHKVQFRNFQSAEEFIKMQKVKPKDEHYYF